MVPSARGRGLGVAREFLALTMEVPKVVDLGPWPGYRTQKWLGWNSPKKMRKYPFTTLLAISKGFSSFRNSFCRLRQMSEDSEIQTFQFGRFHLSGGQKPSWVGIQSPGAPTKNRSVGSSPKSSEKGLDTTWLKDPNSQMAKNRVALWHRYSPGVVNYTDNKNYCSSSHLCQLNPHCLYMYAGDSRLIPILTSKLPLMACLKSSQTTR